jgi:SAM-dependent methyltransferase
VPDLVTAPADRNREHWDALGAGYSDNWSSPAQQALSAKELSFLVRHLPAASRQSVLDVGMGDGRIVSALLAQDRVEALYGVDISPGMVEVCRGRFGADAKVKDLTVCDVAREPLPAPTGLSFISAVRVLKYSANWWDIVEGSLLPHLTPGGVLVFSMPNADSLKRLARPYAVEYFMTTEQELRRRLAGARAAVAVAEISGFSKLPDVLYRSSRSRPLTRSLMAVERGLDRVLGPATLSRELFVAARRGG